MSDPQTGGGMFDEHLVTEESDFIAGSCDVYVEQEGYFITIETCPYEGCAQLTLPLAKKVLESLGRAIKAAESVRSINDGSRSNNE